MSVPQGGTVFFKINTTATAYRVDVYRMGYYGGAGARRVASFSLDLPKALLQPDCLYSPDTHLVDCGNWHVSANWSVPTDATSGIYFARLVRLDPEPQPNWRADNSQIFWDIRFSRPKEEQDPLVPPPGGEHAYGVHGRGRMANALKEPRASHIYFIVRNDVAGADVLFQTMDTTWQTYNCWGSMNTYGYECGDPLTHAGSPHYHKRAAAAQPGLAMPARAYKASLNRPYATRSYRAVNMPFQCEYPMVRWLERNGYDVSYWSGVDTDRLGAAISARFRLFLSVGHDEYWSGRQREHVTAARDAGVHLGFFSGNEVYWRIRWEDGATSDGSRTDSHRTVVVYKDTQATKPLDPVEWTGTFRDGRDINPLGPQPENALTGTIFTVNAWRHDPLVVPAEFAAHRFWRNTTVAALRGDEEAVLLTGLLGHEWDEDVDNGFRPAGLMQLSRTTVDNVHYLVDEGSVFDSGTATHHLTLYRHSSGALVFGAGTVQWMWGLDAHHDSPNGMPPERANPYTIRVGVDRTAPDPAVQQATLNLLVDMGVHPHTPQPDLTLTASSTDTVAPKSEIASCQVHRLSGRDKHRELVCHGVAHDVGGVVAAVEITATAGKRWHPAVLSPDHRTWHYKAVVPAGPKCSLLRNVTTRAVDDSGNLEAPHRPGKHSARDCVEIES
uniref:N,N-dimethylformamidase beta subunit-like C-terminal domain-containing protein n=1 Tax=Eutreptiella gymnastica TaxID=73025 RepID=A0A7S4GIK2_9EUGL